MRKTTTTLLALLLAAAPHAQADQDTKKIRAAAEAAVGSADWDTAVASFRKLTEADPKDARSWHMLGYSLHAGGKLDEALKVHLKAAEFKEVAPVATYNVACVYALTDKKSEALDWLEKAVKLGFNRTETIDGDSDMDSLRSEPRFKEIMKMAEKSASGEGSVSVYAGTFERKLARMVLFGGKGSLGGVSIAYGQPRWQDKFSEYIDSPKSQNRRWRFGRDEWTTLDTSVALSLGDQELAPGVYYLTLERRDGNFVLAAIDPSTVHKYTIDPYVAHLTKGGTEVVLKHSKADEVSEVMEIQLKEGMGAPGSGDLVIRFGPHKLSAPFALRTKGKDSGAK